MEIIYFFRHKTAGWEGVVCRCDDGRCFITDGRGAWEVNEKRRALIVPVPKISPETLRRCREKFPVIRQAL